MKKESLSMKLSDLKIFALNSTKEFGEQISNQLEVSLSKHEEFFFQDKEPYCASLENVRGCDVFVVQSLYSDEFESVSDKVMKMFVMAGSLKDASAKRITFICPYLSFSRQDRKTHSRAPITTKIFAMLMESVNVNRLLTLDNHSPTAIQNAYRLNVDLLESKNLMSHWASLNVPHDNLVVLSPDSGGLSRADRFKSKLSKHLVKEHIGIACMHKTHEGNNIQGHGIMGDVVGKSVLIYDDIISSGKTILECVKAVKSHGAKEAFVFAAHGLYVGSANEYLDNDFLKVIVTTDTIKPFRLYNENINKKLVIINTTGLFAEAIRRIHKNESISDLIK